MAVCSPPHDTPTLISSHHQLSRLTPPSRKLPAICYGQRGEIRKRYREGQEDQLSALGLVTNSLILWNTIYIQASLDHLSQQSFQIIKEDEVRLSPLVTGHINMWGHYTFTLSRKVMEGSLRSLNALSEQIFIP